MKKIFFIIIILFEFIQLKAQVSNYNYELLYSNNNYKLYYNQPPTQDLITHKLSNNDTLILYTIATININCDLNQYHQEINSIIIKEKKTGKIVFNSQDVYICNFLLNDNISNAIYKYYKSIKFKIEFMKSKDFFDGYRQAFFATFRIVGDGIVSGEKIQSR